MSVYWPCPMASFATSFRQQPLRNDDFANGLHKKLAHGGENRKRPAASRTAGALDDAGVLHGSCQPQIDQARASFWCAANKAVFCNVADRSCFEI